MKIETVILDDDPKDIIQIENTLNKIESRSDVIFKTITLQDPDYLVSYDRQIYIIDIELGNQSGFTAAERIKTNNPSASIIFCTSHDDLVFQSFNTDVFFFVRKDHLEEDMFCAMRKYLHNTHQKYYLYRHNGEIIPIPYADIMYFEIVVNELHIHTISNKEYRERKSIRYLLTEIPSGQFLQPSSHFLVNCFYISEIRNREIILKDDSRISISRSRYKETEESYLRYLAWR